MISFQFIIFITIIVIIGSEKSDGARILGIFPLNGKSHFVICEQLMKSLASKGHQVDVISHFPLKKPFPNYTDFSLEGSLPNVINNMTYNTFRNFTGKNFKCLLEITGTQTCKLFSHPVIKNIIENPPKDPPYDLVIVEVFTAHCYFAFGRHLNVPMIGISTAALYEWINDIVGNSNNIAFTPAGFSGFPQKMNFWQRLKNVFVSFLIKFQINYYTSQQQKFVDEYFGPEYPSIDELAKDLALVFVNSHYSLNGVQPLTPSVIEIGGLHINDSGERLVPELQQWLDESKHGCVFISFGSMIKIESFPKETLDAFYATFKNIAPVRVLMKIANKEELPSGLSKNVQVYPWLPQIQVLKHRNVKAFITHGGLMSTLESIYCGVPMIGIPLFGDQIPNIDTCVKKKMAISLDYTNITEQQLTIAVNMILNNTDFRDNVKKVSKLYYDRPMSPKDTAVFWTEYIMRNGKILQSPAINLSRWQVQLLDVYGFILFIISFIICIILLLTKFIIKCILNSPKADKDKILSKKMK